MLPLIERYDAAAPLIRGAGAGLTQAQFVAAVLQLAGRLPQAPAAFNLCEDRARFMLAFAALALRGQLNLLPPSTAPGLLAQIAAAHPGCYVLADRELADAPCTVLQVAAPQPGAALPAMPQLPADRVVALAYTSGSTGAPQGHAKTWGTLMQTARLAAARLFDGAPVHVVGTVPPQHMYGLETTMSLALAAGCSTHAWRPFFPQDVADALADVPAPRALVTTPLHLRALLAAGVRLPALQRIVSATAPLTAEIAAQAEARYATEVHEIYGCTEAGSMATRRTASTDLWQWHAGMHLEVGGGASVVHGAHLPAPVPLQDRLEICGAAQFRLLGRGDDMLKVAGKRASLAELTARLLAVRGVEDGIVFLPPAASGAEPRPAALVVAPGLGKAQILAQLAQSVDAVLLPRPLVRLARLPRNELGKLPRAALLAALEQGDDV